EFSDLFSPALEDMNMKMDVQDCGDHYQLKADLPGVKKEDIKVDFNEGNLTISAQHHKSSEKNDENGYIVKERSSGLYQRSIHFADADAKNINAAFANGELDIRIDKLANEDKSTSIVIH
ncbi:MAG: Hsp20/alpha crystallin family protein, partial [Lachnospiraceae bacterium]|nr:Hsp20/alpha crystallin family protein [Lachnospiraceae bacterium]